MASKEDLLDGNRDSSLQIKENLLAMKQERAKAKGAITRKKNAMEKIAISKENVEEVKEDLCSFLEIIENFEGIHQSYVSLLQDPDDIDEAKFYRQAVISDAEKFEQQMHCWIARQEADDDEEEKADNIEKEKDEEEKDDDIEKKEDSTIVENPITPDVELLKEEHRKVAQLLADIQEARKLEEETHNMRLAVEKENHQFKLRKYENEISLQKERIANHDKQKHLEENLLQYSEAVSVGPTLNLPLMSTPGRTDSEQNALFKPIVNSASVRQKERLHDSNCSLIEENDEVKAVKEVLTSAVANVLNESRVQQQSIVHSLQLPRRELQTFDGDCLQYWPFIRSFHSIVDTKAIDSATKLSCLLMYCKGNVRRMLNCCEIMDPEEGYVQALKILEDRFGNKFEISQKWIQKIINRPNLKGPSDLQSFADDLKCCQQTLKTMGYESELDNSASLHIIWKKLPQYMQYRWTRINHTIKKEQNRIPKLTDLVNFIQDLAEEANDPVFAKSSFNESTKGKENNQKSTTWNQKRTGSFAVKTSSGTSKSHTTNTCDKKQNNTGGCPCCGQSHYIVKCPQFKAMKIKERRNLVMSKGLCINCFAKGHMCNECPKTFVCDVEGCGLKHSKFLHLSAKPQESITKTQMKPAQENSGEVATMQQSSHYVRSNGGKLAVPIVVARVWCPNTYSYVDVYAMLDQGSNYTYCTEELSRYVGAKGFASSFELTTLTQEKMNIESAVVNLSVSKMKDSMGPNYTIEATVLPKLNIDLTGRSTQVDVERWPHLKDLEIPELEIEQVHLLIGQDSSDLLIPSEVRRGGPGEPFAVLTPLGWAINGPVNPLGNSSRISCFIRSSREIESDLKRLWEIEGAHNEEKAWSVSDHKAVNKWNSTLQVKENHYSMSIPFKAEHPTLPDNKSMAEKRLKSLSKRLDKDETLKKQYTGEVHKLVEKGYAEVVSEDALHEDGKVWYLPHHPVINPKKPDKCRIVFDCAAKFCGQSLNDHVHQGPDMANSLVGVLLRFRQHAVAFMADIEAMFHQVQVTPEDRDVLRFLWFENDDTSQPLRVFRMTAHLFGGVWSPSCANFALRQVAKEYEDIYSKEVLETICCNFYVDDCLKSVDSVDSAISLALQVKEVLGKRGFNLTKFVSSSPEVLKHLPQEDWGKNSTTFNLNLEELPPERALGMLWNVNTDCLGFDVQIEQKKDSTRRVVLSTLSAVYDPLGYISPFILQARRIFQQLCRLLKGWDEPLPEDLEEQWGRWLDDLPKIKWFRVPRCINPTDIPVKRAQLHHFADASEYGYGAVSFIRLVLEDDSIFVNLIMAKSRLAPLKGSTIPRLELAGALEAVRLDKILSKELEIELDTSVYWVDSQIVLWYLNRSDQRFQTYVANRVAKIMDHSEVTQWRYVPSEENPGDDTSRGLTATDLLKLDRWVHGPEFLQYEEHKWPIQPTFQCSDLEGQLEIKAEPVVYVTKTEEDHTSTLLNHYSSWFKLKKAVVWYSRFKSFMMNKSEFGPITVNEINDAEVRIIQYIQRTLQEKLLQMKKLHPVKSQDNLVRVGGRLANSHIEEDAKHPIILPYNHHVSRLIVLHYHHMTGHAGVERVLAEIREKFWILKGRKLVKSVVYHCVTCRRKFGKTEVQQMASLPESRVTPFEPAFTRVGVDYFGPFLVKRGRSEVKRYGCVFTCFATRAIHIEVAHSLTTDSFINALERFIARRGEPKEIWSDNGSNFVGAHQELKKNIQDWNKDKIHDHLLKKEIKWNFNPPTASHMGGVWERQIRTIRKVLDGIVKQQSLDDESLITLLTVVEGIVNNRPITKLSDDPRDDKPLTPNHILMLRSGSSLPPGEFTERDQYRRRWKQVQYLADVFWHRWLKEYLPNLQERHKWLKVRRNFKIGDLVLVKQESTPRNQWPLGLVVGVHTSTDGLVRSLEVRTNTGTYERPITKICLLEGTDSDRI